VPPARYEQRKSRSAPVHLMSYACCSSRSRNKLGHSTSVNVFPASSSESYATAQIRTIIFNSVAVVEPARGAKRSARERSQCEGHAPGLRTLPARANFSQFTIACAGTNELTTVGTEEHLRPGSCSPPQNIPQLELSLLDFPGSCKFEDVLLPRSNPFSSPAPIL
jgi:hypothetical protein